MICPPCSTNILSVCPIDPSLFWRAGESKTLYVPNPIAVNVSLVRGMSLRITGCLSEAGGLSLLFIG